MKKILKSKHDRSLSLDCENDSLNSSCFSNKVSFLESHKKNKLSRLNSISLLNSNQKSNRKQPPPQQYSANLLDITLQSTKNSPHKNKSMLSFLCVSQASSALKTSKSTDSRKERKEEQLSKAITNAIGIQQEKDKNLIETKETFIKENELSKIDLQALEARAMQYRNCFYTKRSLIMHELKEIQKYIPRDIPHFPSSNDSVENDPSDNQVAALLRKDKKEVVKSMQVVNYNICKGLAYLQNIFSSESNLSTTSPETQSIIATLNYFEKKLKEIYAEKDILVYKVFEAGDRHEQLRETTAMLEEDFHSNVEQLTEYVAWQEDLESYFDHLRWKNPEYFDKLQAEIANAEKQMNLMCKIKELETVLSNKKEEYQQKQIDQLDLMKLQEDENNHYNCYTQMKDLILEDIFKREKTLFFIFYKNYHQLRKQYDLHQLFAFLKLFDLNLQALQQECDESTNILMEYHYIMLEEIEEVVSYIQDTQNLENTLSTLQMKSEGQQQQHPVLQTIHNQGIFRKVQMKERLAKIQEQKTKLYSGAADFQNAQDLLRDHKNLSLIDICQELSSRLGSQQPFLKEMFTNLFALAQKKKENYQAFFDLKNSIEEKSKQLASMQSKIQVQKKELETLKTQVLEEETKIAEMNDQLSVLKNKQKEIEELYTELSKKEREKIYSNYLVDSDGYFKKVKFQFGDNYLTKIQQSVLDDFTNVSQKDFSKKKAQIAEINFILKKLEKQQESCNYQIEHVIPKEYEQMKATLAEYEARIGVLNKELLEQLFEERELVDSLEKSVQEDVLCFREDLKQLLESIFDDVQNYKTNVLHCICQVINQILLPNPKLEGQQITPARRRELESVFHKLQRELDNITEAELQQVNVFEEKMQQVKAEMAEREENIKKIEEQLKSTRRMYNITGSVLKEKTNTLNTMGTTLSSASNLNKSGDTSLTLGSFAQGSVASGCRTANSSPFARSERRNEKGPSTDCKTNFPGSLIKPRDRSKPLRSPYDYLSPKESCLSSEVNTHRHGVSTDMSSSRSFPRVQSIATLQQQQSVMSSFGGMSSNMSLTKSPSMAGIGSSNRSMMIDAQDTYDNRTNFQTNAPKKFDLESYLCSQEKEFIEKSIKVLEEGVTLFKKFASNNGLAIKSIDPTTPGHKRGNSASKGALDIEPKGYGKRVMKLNKINKTIEIYKFKQFSDKKTLEYYYDFKYINKIFYPAVLIDILRKLRHQKNKENEKQVTIGKNTALDAFSQEILLPFGVEVQNRGRIEFLIGELDSLKFVSTCISYIIRAKAT